MFELTASVGQQGHGDVFIYKLLARIPGNVAQTFFSTVLLGVFLFWQIVSIHLSLIAVSHLDMILLLIQASAVIILSVKLVLWFHQQTR